MPAPAAALAQPEQEDSACECESELPETLLETAVDGESQELTAAAAAVEEVTEPPAADLSAAPSGANRRSTDAIATWMDLVYAAPGADTAVSNIGGSNDDADILYRFAGGGDMDTQDDDSQLPSLEEESAPLALAGHSDGSSVLLPVGRPRPQISHPYIAWARLPTCPHCGQYWPDKPRSRSHSPRRQP